METNITKVYVVEEFSCIHGDAVFTIIGIYSSLDKAQEAYEYFKSIIERDSNCDETWYKDENTQSTNMYFELMDNNIAPEKYYQLQLEEKPLL